MSLELIPIVLGVLIAALGILLVADAFMPDRERRIAERRSRARPERHRVGEALLGGGIVALGAALIGRDTWNYTNLALALAVVMFVVGLVLNYKYLRGRFFGPTRGHEMSRRATDIDPPEQPKMRVR